MSTYIMAGIRPRNGVMREIHKEVLGCQCYIVDLAIGGRGLIKYKPRDSDCYHRLYTSPIMSFSPCWNGEETITVETENTVYEMRLVKEGAA